MATERSRTTPVARVLQVCLHLLVAGLLALAVARAAFVDRGGDPAAVAAAASATAAVYAAGPRLAAVRRSRRGAALWLALLGVTWAGLLVATQDGVWLAFPLYFLELHLLGRRSGLAAVGLTAAASIAAWSWHSTASASPPRSVPPSGRPSPPPPCSATRRCTGRARSGAG